MIIRMICASAKTIVDEQRQKARNIMRLWKYIFLTKRAKYTNEAETTSLR